jgi:formamidopyrimidine-DNA glycosylase
MPELPEVETIRRDLESRVVGRRITRVHIPPDRVPVVKGMEEAAFREGVAGARIEAVSRRGKYLLLALGGGASLVIHLRMTGALLHRRPEAPPDPYLRAVLSLDDGSELRFSDLRKFGGLWLADDPAAVLPRLGPEPLDDGFSPGYLAGALAGRRAPVKSVLLDQGCLAGVGNIYADEALFAAGIDPRGRAADLPPAAVRRLHAAVRGVLLRGIESRGASFRDYIDADGREGNMQMHVRVFRRTGKPCYACATPIERVKVGGRATHFCPRCQT